MRHLATLDGNVVLLARSADRIGAIASEITARGGTSLAIAGDVSRYANVAAAVDAPVAAFGSLDVLVNNAGLIEPIARLADSDVEADLAPSPTGYIRDLQLDVNGEFGVSPKPEVYSSADFGLNDHLEELLG